MDPVRFDTLAKSLSTPDTRRGLLRLLAALPIAGAVLARWDEETIAGNGGKGGKGKSRHGRKGKSGRHTSTRHGCIPESTAKTCKGRCGTVTNRCGKTVDCSPCTCATGCHPVCQACNPVTDTCDAINAGGDCGEPGQVCQADGTCSCVGGECPTCHSCVGGVCTKLPDGTVCGTQSERGYTQGAAPGAIRCCDGACPDPDCYPSGENGVSCGAPYTCPEVSCCSQDNWGCATGEFCYCGPPGAGGHCGSDYDCGGTQFAIAGTATACICGTCQEPP